MEQIKHFNKLQENEMQNKIRKSILNNKTYVNFVIMNTMKIMD